jgi:CBS-domain-containing membrane protein
MEKTKDDHEISDEDIRAALKEMRSYVDITEEDLKKIYSIALKHAKERLKIKIPVSDVMTKNVVSVKKDLI